MEFSIVGLTPYPPLKCFWKILEKMNYSMVSISGRRYIGGSPKDYLLIGSLFFISEAFKKNYEKFHYWKEGVGGLVSNVNFHNSKKIQFNFNTRQFLEAIK